jgi:hypothetical protein
VAVQTRRETRIAGMNRQGGVYCCVWTVNCARLIIRDADCWLARATPTRTLGESFDEARSRPTLNTP